MDVAVTTTDKVFPHDDLLSNSRYEELKNLVAELIRWQNEAPQDLITFCEKVSRHPDPVLAKQQRGNLREARLKYSEFLQLEFRQVFPIRFPSLMRGLILSGQAQTQLRIKREAHIMKDRNGRALSKVSQLRRIWDFIGLPLDKRAKMEYKKETSYPAGLQRGSPAKATYSLGLHVELMKKHVHDITILLKRLDQFWEIYIQGICDLDLATQDPNTSGTWRMEDVFEAAIGEHWQLRIDISSVDPTTFDPHPRLLKHA